ncbi:MAG: ParB/RepB/Spo0J family partition protein [Chloroflexi bacterium]|nr:ParB/RepB/Spo0J family partition protein [Chloroflexota bacterium]
MARRSAGPTTPAPPTEPVLQLIPVDRVDLPRRPARHFLGDVAALAESMRDYGLQQPISVRADGDRFILTSGMRRLAAARMLDWTAIPGFVRTVSADQAYLLDLIENLQREDLSAEEEADAFGELVRTRGWTLQQVAESVKRSVAYISKRVRVFEDPLLREAIVERGLPVSTAEELLATRPEDRARLVQRAIREHWDQDRARDALRQALERLPEHAEPDVDVLNRTDEHSPDGSRAHRGLAVESVRPKGFTRAVREFHRLLITVQAGDLTSTDRAALRALFRDLQMLARAPATRSEPVFPPLPSGEQSRSRRGRTRRPSPRR